MAKYGPNIPEMWPIYKLDLSQRCQSKLNVALPRGPHLGQTCLPTREAWGQKIHSIPYFISPPPCLFLCSSALDLLQTAIEKAGFTEKVVVGMDVAASEFYREGKYDLDFKSPPDPERHITAEELADIYQGFVNSYPGLLI